MRLPGSKSHKLHRKASVARYIQRNRRIWRLYWRLNKIFIELGLEVDTGRLK